VAVFIVFRHHILKEKNGLELRVRLHCVARPSCSVCLLNTRGDRMKPDRGRRHNDHGFVDGSYAAIRARTLMAANWSAR